MAKLPEVARSKGKSPRRIEPIAVLEALQQPPSWRKDVDEPKARAIAAPVSTEFADPGTFTTAAVPEFQAEMVPSNDTKMKWAACPGVTAKSVVLPLKTIPVGLPIVAGGVAGMVTTRGTIVPAPL
jgi:hypothetical protein